MMDFSGWQKLTLVDFDQHIATTLFTAGCDFRCPFCHNRDLVLNPQEAPIIPWDEIVSYLKKRQGVLDGVVITGGEPTLMPDLVTKFQEIRSLGYAIKLDTNGSRPMVLKALLEAHLVDYVAMDIKNSEEKYAETIGLPKADMEAIHSSIAIIMNEAPDYEFRTTIFEELHDEEAMLGIGRLIHGAKRLFLQRYIDSEHCIQGGFHEVNKEKATHFAELLKKDIEQVELRGYL